MSELRRQVGELTEQLTAMRNERDALKALKLAQIAVKGERTTEHAVPGVLPEAKTEHCRPKEGQSEVVDQLADQDAEFGDTMQELEPHMSEDTAGRSKPIMITATGVASQKHRTRVETLKTENFELIAKSKPPCSPGGNAGDAIEAESLIDAAELARRRKPALDVSQLQARLDTANEAVAMHAKKAEMAEERLASLGREVTRLRLALERADAARVERDELLRQVEALQMQLKHKTLSSQACGWGSYEVDGASNSKLDFRTAWLLASFAAGSAAVVFLTLHRLLVVVPWIR